MDPKEAQASDISRISSGRERGTVLAGERRIPGYPRIGRVFSLAPGLKRAARAFYVEEKLDGFNARYFIHGGQIYGLTRGGFVCPYLTDRTDLIDRRFFDDHPDMVLCGEIVGKANPYTRESHLAIDDVEFFLFDILVRPLFDPFVG